MRAEELYKYFLATEGISTDTRKIKPNSMFFALKGPNFDANTLAEEALEKALQDLAGDSLEAETLFTDETEEGDAV